MKKIFLLVSLLAVAGIKMMASLQECDQNIGFTVGIVEPSDSHGGHPRTPVACPNVTQEGHALYFNVGYDLTLLLLDEDGEEAYTTFAPAGTTTVVLPSTLSGEYELQLLPGGSFYFYTVIQL